MSEFQVLVRELPDLHLVPNLVVCHCFLLEQHFHMELVPRMKLVLPRVELGEMNCRRQEMVQ